MANNKEFYSRIVHKHDIEANWDKATGFTPLQGEIIVYDKDDTYDYERIKIGDGITKVIDLPFILDSVDEMVEDVVADLGAVTIDIGQADSTTPNGINADSVKGLTEKDLITVNLGGEAVDDTIVTLNAQQLGGINASEYVLKRELININLSNYVTKAELGIQVTYSFDNGTLVITPK